MHLALDRHHNQGPSSRSSCRQTKSSSHGSRHSRPWTLLTWASHLTSCPTSCLNPSLSTSSRTSSCRSQTSSWNVCLSTSQSLLKRTSPKSIGDTWSSGYPSWMSPSISRHRSCLPLIGLGSPSPWRCLATSSSNGVISNRILTNFVTCFLNNMNNNVLN